MNITKYIVPFLISFLLPVSNNNTLNKANDFEKGNFTNLIVFAKFNGEEEFINNEYNNASIREIVDNMYNNSYYSIKNYFKLLSNNKVKMNNVFLFDNGQSLTLSNKRGYYSPLSDTNPIGYEKSNEASRSYDLKEDWSSAINKVLKKQSNLYSANGDIISDYSILDQNNDNKIDAITILYKETPSDFTGEWASMLWNYQDSCSLVELEYNNKTITSDKYVQITNTYSESTLYVDKDGYLINNLAIAAHEMGHIFGLKDLYRSASDSRVYYMSSMGRHFTPVPQYISTKEREALGWLNDGQIKTITSNGEYTLNVVQDDASNKTISYKLDLKNGKTAYLEYRNFAAELNRFDNQYSILTKPDGSTAPRIKAMKSGLVVFLVDSDTKFPNNMGTTGNKWNYEVLGGQYATKSDAALQENEEISLTNTIDVFVNSVSETELTFTLTGGDFEEIISPEITGIEIISYPQMMRRNDSYKCEAKINGNNLLGDEKVFWSINGNTSNKTNITDEGLLTIGNDENSSIISLIAKTENNISAITNINLNIIHALTHIDYLESTCKDTGNKEYWYCQECNKYFIDSNHNKEVNYNDLIIPTNDNHQEKIVIPFLDSTCSELGHTAKIICSICEKILQESTIIPKKEHVLETIKGHDATCENDGLTDGLKCSICNEIIKEQEVIKHKGHILSDYIIDKNPTQYEEGKKHIECTVCYKIISVETIEKLPAQQTNVYITVVAFSLGSLIIITILLLIKKVIVLKK